MKRILAAFAGMLLLSTLAARPALAGGRSGERGRDGDSTPSHREARAPHTVTYWCLDLNRLWHVDARVVVGVWALAGGDPALSPYCGDPETGPVVVGRGEPFAPGLATTWFTNKTYPAGYGDALAARGFTFHSRSSSPAEEFLRNVTNVRVVLATIPEDVVVAEYNFDAHRNFRMVRTGEFFFGQYALGDSVDPNADVALTLAEINRLPAFNFPVVVPAPLQPGMYRAYVSWTLAEDSWDGLGFDPWSNLLPAGENLMSLPPFAVR